MPDLITGAAVLLAVLAVSFTAYLRGSASGFRRGYRVGYDTGLIVGSARERAR